MGASSLRALNRARQTFLLLLLPQYQSISGSTAFTTPGASVGSDGLFSVDIYTAPQRSGGERAAQAKQELFPGRRELPKKASCLHQVCIHFVLCLPCSSDSESNTFYFTHVLF
jgi:hypothetical protein